MYNDINDTYILAEYTIEDKETGRPIHKRLNLQYKRNPFNGAILNARVYGTWRNRGFWTEKDYAPEEGLGDIMTRAQMKFMTPEVVKSDEEFSKAKADLDKELASFMDKIEGASAIHVGVYGADHKGLDLGSDPAINNKSNIIDVTRSFT